MLLLRLFVRYRGDGTSRSDAAAPSGVRSRVTTTRLRKKCPDCGKRGNWPKQLVEDPCEDCTRIRLHHDAIRADFYKRCTNVKAGADMCHPTRPPMCPSCVEYFASDTHAFFTRPRR
jgi:hypothetical protein